MDPVSLTKTLVSLPSYVDGRQTEAPVAQYLEGYVRKNLPWLRVKKQKVAPRRYNIIASKNDGPRVVFVSHMDTVLPAGNVKDRLRPQVEKGILRGLGACDMKSGLAASVTAVEKSGPESGGALIFDVDEEYYFAGVRKLVSEINLRPRLAVFPEPTDLQILSGCRGIEEVKVEVMGKTAHAGSPGKGINAIKQALRLAQALEKTMLRGDDPRLGRTTVNLSAIRGGVRREGGIKTQANAVPDIAEILLDIRTASTNLDFEEVQRRIRQTARGLDIRLGEIAGNLDYPGALSPEDDLVLLEQAVRSVMGKAQYRPLQSAGYFEAPFLDKAWGCATAAFGPGNNAHQADEYVPVNDILKTEQVFLKLLE